MLDTVIYCSDLIALKTQLIADGYYDEESGTYTVGHSLTPLKYKGNTSLSYVRDNALDMSVYTMLEDLGTYDEIWADVVKDDKYKSVYDYTIIQTYTDEAGNVQTYTLPKEIGRFA